MKFKRLLFFLLISISSKGYGQQYEAYKINFGVNDGLPSSECYEIIQDSKGYIWFGTDRGVVKYNGYEFITYTTKEGLNNNVVFYLKEGPDGKIWFYDIENQLSYYSNGKITQFKYNKSLNNYLPKNSKPIGFSIDVNNNIYFNFIGDVKDLIKCVSIDGKVTLHESNSHDILFSYVDNNITTAHFTNKALNKKSVSVFDVCHHKKDSKTTFNLTSNLNIYNSIFRYKVWDNNIYFSYMNELYFLSSKGEIRKLHTFDNSIIELEIQTNGDLYVGLYEDGLEVLPSGDPGRRYSMISDCSVSGLFIDETDGLWLTTQDKGIYYIPKSKFSQHFQSKNQLINHITGNDNTIIYTNYSGEIYNLNTGSKLDRSFRKLGFIRNLIPVENGFFLGSLSSNYHFVCSESSISYNNMLGSSADWLIAEDHIFGIFNGKISSFDKSSYHYKEQLVSTNVKFDCIEKGFKNNDLLLGSSQGVYSYDFDTLQREFTKFDVYNTRVSDFLRNQDVLYTATRGEGLIIHRENKKPYALTKAKGLISNELHKLKFFKENLFVLSKEGLSIIDCSVKELKIVNFSNKNGLISNEVNDVFVRNDTVWVATNKGITKFNLDEIENIDPDGPIYLKGLLINNQHRKVDELSSLSYDENELEFSFEAISFNNYGSINYKYKLIGVDEKWNYTQSRKLRYPNLIPGNYQLIISYQKPDMSWSTPTTLFKMSVSKPFWENLAFIIPTFIVVFFLIYFVIQRYLSKAKGKIEIQKKILDLERRALQAQMSPHFIFNALSSIQSLIAQKRNEHAEEFLIAFSRLVRTSLNQSSQSFVTLKEEVELLNNYLKIEALRFEEVFDWNISIEETLDQGEESIPPMIIQPFVENAIEHGLRPLGRKGSLSIDISVKGKLLEIKIDDDGVGRLSASEKKILGRESKGINLVKDRLSLLHRDTEVLIIDKNDNGSSFGTLVVLMVPFQKK